MGITNEAFQQERDETPSCQFATVPNDVTPSVCEIGAIENFANFQRFLAPATPVSSFNGASSSSISRGRQQFTSLGCALCHTPQLRTNPKASVGALANKTAPCTPSSRCIRWDPDLPTTFSKGQPAVTSSGPRHCGAWASGSSKTC